MIHRKTIWPKASLLSMAVLGVSSSTVNAELVYFSYTDTEGTLQEKSISEFINGTNLMIGVSAGLDRKIKLTVNDNSTGEVVYSEVSDYITVNDRVSNPTGSDFYGKKFNLPTLISGNNYTIKQEVLDLEEDTVKEQQSSFTIDVSAPSLIEVNSVNNGGTVNPSGFNYNGEQVLSRRSTSHLEVPYSYQDSPPDKATWTIYEVTDSGLTYKKEVDGDISDNNDGTGTIYLRKSGHVSGYYGLTSILDSYSSRYKFVLDVTDSAGNKVEIDSENSWVTCNFNENVKWSTDMYSIIGITDSNSDGIDGIDGSEGFRAFSPGDEIPENPAGLIISIPLEYSRYTDPIYGYSPQYLSYDNISQPFYVDSENAYYFQSKITIQSNGQAYGRRVNSGGDLCTGYLNIGTNFTSSSLPPEISGPEFKLKLDGQYYTYQHGSSSNEYMDAINEYQASLPQGSYNDFYLSSSGLWSRLDGVEIVVGERNYDQTVYTTFDTSKKCVIAAGDTSCEIEYDMPFESISSMWKHTGTGIISTSDIGSAYDAIVFKIDLDAPKFENYNFDTETSIISGRIDNTKNSDVNGSRKPVNVFAEATNTVNGNVVNVFGILSSLNDGYEFDYSIDLNTLPDGSYDIVLHSYDQAGNHGSLVLDQTINLDTSPPVITLLNNGSSHNTDTTVEGLESLLVKLTDSSDAYITKIRLLNGPASDSLIMDWIDAENYTYTLEYPRIFPSLEEGSEYTLAITASDIYQNEATYEFVFNYMPANIIELETGILLPTESILLDSDDSPIYQIVTSKLRDNEGQLVTGELPVAFTVRADSEVSLIVNGKSVQPGETYEWNYDVSDSNGVLRLPITSDDKIGGKHGDFMFEVSGVTTSQ